MVKHIINLNVDTKTAKNNDDLIMFFTRLLSVFMGLVKTISKSILSYSLIKAFLLKSSTGIKWIGM